MSTTTTTSSSPESAPPRRSAGPRRRPGRPCSTARIGVTALTEPWVEKYDLPVRIDAPLAVEPTEVLPRVEARRLDRCQQVALVAAREAWADAGAPELDPERLGVVVGTGIGGALTLLGQDDILETAGPPQGRRADRPDADAERSGGRGRPVGEGPRRRARAGVGLRLRRRGHRLGLHA